MLAQIELHALRSTPMSCLVCFLSLYSLLSCCIAVYTVQIPHLFIEHLSFLALEMQCNLWNIFERLFIGFLIFELFSLFSRLDTYTLSKYTGLDPGTLYLFRLYTIFPHDYKIKCTVRGSVIDLSCFRKTILLLSILY